MALVFLVNYLTSSISLLLTPAEAVALIAALSAIGVPWVVTVGIIFIWLFKKENNKK